jgi:hypothetical protein
MAEVVASLGDGCPLSSVKFLVVWMRNDGIAQNREIKIAITAGTSCAIRSANRNSPSVGNVPLNTSNSFYSAYSY